MFKSTLLTLAALFAFSAPAMEREKLNGIYLPAGKTLEQVQQTPKEMAWNNYLSLEQPVAAATVRARLLHPLCTLYVGARYYAAKIIGKSNNITRTLDGKEQLSIKKCGLDISGEGYVQYFKRCGENCLAIIAQTAALLRKPTAATQVIEELHSKGVTQRIASNIGANIFASLKERFKSKYNNRIFDNIITSGQVVDYSDFGPDKSVPNLGEINATKRILPEAQYYNEYNARYNPKNEKIIVHVSEKPEILAAAAQAGWAGIHYDATTMSIQELRTRMAKLGLPVNK